MIVVSAEMIRACHGATQVEFMVRESEDIYNAICSPENRHTVTGSICHVAHLHDLNPAAIGKPEDRVRIAYRRTPDGVEVRGYVFRDGRWGDREVQLIPLKEDLFSRTSGLLETDVISDRRVFIAGLGSGGAPIALELVKSGVMNIDLMDDDRLEVGNVLRHQAGLSDAGRYKTHYTRDAIIDKNPYVTVRSWEQRMTWDSIDLVRDVVRASDLVICAIDERVGRQVLNRVCVEEGKPCVFAAAFRRAYGGQVLVLEPGKTPCYECFLERLPDSARDQEISNARSASRIAYSDRPVAIEPGLSTDIAPISHMATKIALQILLRDRPSALRSLDDDLTASWYLWLNRREPGTDYEKFEPLGCSIGGLHILRWYGIEFDRNPSCPVCGDFTGHLAAEAGLGLFDDDIQRFALKVGTTG